MDSEAKKAFPFKLSDSKSASISDAETLFRDLKNRDPKIQHLWSHQADIIRTYHKDVDKRDIALELPTGTGKTLVGLLIAEWRRRELKERVLYLCPTRQLAYQVGAKADEYGINSPVLVGPQRDYSPTSFSAYVSADAVAITTYSGLFNTNPRFANPETIIFDDAHAGDSYISGLWSLSISRYDHRDLYDQIIKLYLDEIPRYIIPDLLSDNPTPLQRQNLDVIPSPRLMRKAEALTDVLNASANHENKLIYPWQLLQGNLAACSVFVSWSEILIRPFIPPTLLHTPFSNAKQRIYMSATLGAGGELERITGIPSIHRIPAPQGWDKQSTGRKLFIFPDRSFAKDDYQTWVSKFIASQERSLVLTPNNYSLDQFSELLSSSKVGHEILKSHQVETSLDNFTNSSNVVLGLTNRYDGIDLPGDTCRSLIIYELPASVNLLERFLWSKLGATAVLRDRIRTRITQAVGRCTRNSTDYAVVLMLGENLLDFCIRKENKNELHPELRAEMEFGLDNSDTENIDGLSSLTELFLSRSSEWDIAEKDIARRRNSAPDTSSSSYLAKLRSIVSLEVMYQYDIWKGDYDAALSKATKIIDTLSGESLSAYRALWNYFAGCAAYYLGSNKKDKKIIQTAADRFYRASQANLAISWFTSLSHELAPENPTLKELSSGITLSVSNISKYITHLGMTGAKFEKNMKRYHDYIQAIDADNFDRALTELGKMLGFDAEKPNGQAVPDSVWRLGDEYVLLFESKSEETPEHGISVSTCRQAQGHKDWQSAHPFFTQYAEVITIVVSPRTLLDKSAEPHAKDLFYANVNTIRELFVEVEACLRAVRSKSTALESEQMPQIIQESFKSAELSTKEIAQKLKETALLSLDRQ